MKKIKHLALLISITLVTVGLFSCNNEDNINDIKSQEFNNINAKSAVNDETPYNPELFSDPNYIQLESSVIDLFNNLNEENNETLALMSDNEVKELFKPVAESTIDLLISHYGFSYDELEYEFDGNMEDPGIILLGTSIVTSTSFEWDPAKAAGCAAEALGLNIFDALRNLGGEVTKKVWVV